MAGQKLQTFFGDDLEETLDSLLSAPGAFGNIFIGVAKQVRLFDGIVLALVFTGWGWLLFGYALGDNDDTLLLVLAIVPTAVWVLAGLIGGLVFEIGNALQQMAAPEGHFLLSRRDPGKKITQKTRLPFKLDYRIWRSSRLQRYA